MKLHHAPRSRSVRARWLLEELGVPYELIRRESAAEAPVLVDGDTTLTESAAIVLYVADRHPGFAPLPSASERGDYLQWLVFSEGTLDPVVVGFLTNPTGPRDRLEQLLAITEARVASREYVVGDTFTAADIVLASILHLANQLKLLEAHPKLYDYTLRHAKRPAVRRALS
jgi:glutathione S-transferase